MPLVSARLAQLAERLRRREGLLELRRAQLGLCPCHGSRFSTDGEVLHGPAVDALERHALTGEQGAPP